MKRRLMALILAATMAVLLAFAGMASAQEATGAWSLPELNGPSVWSAPQGAPPKQSTAQDAPEGLTFSSASPSATALLRQPPFPPTDVSLFAPTGRTKDRRPTIAATVSDRDTNLAKTNIRLFVDGKAKTAFTYDRTTDRLKYESGRLSFGKHAVRVVATDAQGKRRIESWSFKVVR